MKKRVSLLLLVFVSLLLTGCGSSTLNIKDIVEPQFVDFISEKKSTPNHLQLKQMKN